MTWESASEFWSMRGYGLYVWGSYAMTLALMLYEAVSVRRGRRAALQAAAAPADPSQVDA